jgi:hypothetical protein
MINIFQMEFVIETNAQEQHIYLSLLKIFAKDVNLDVLFANHHNFVISVTLDIIYIEDGAI